MTTELTEVIISDLTSRISCRIAGQRDNPAVLLVHGWGSSADGMQPIQNWLSESYFVINIDLPGHGASPPPPVVWGVDEHAAALRQIIDHYFDGSFSFVGHSNGGRLGLFLASEPDPPEGLVRIALISPSGIRRRRSAKFYLRRGISSALRAPFQVLPGRLRDFGLDWLRHSLVWKALGSADYRKLEGVMREVFVRTVNCYLEDRLADVSVPVLIFYGADDSAVTSRQMRTLIDGIPDAGLAVVENAGHFSHLDRPDIVRAGLIQFLTTA